MILGNDNIGDTLVIGDLMEKGFAIDNNPKMFSILSSKLYSDKVLAPIRELSCNAYDSHVEAGTPNRPIHVKLPSINNVNSTEDDRTFYVQDFGTGLTGYQIQTLYTTYGRSTKDNSNDVIGCLGLGSKSPFAYTNTFNIESNVNGKKWVYIATVNDGYPTITKFIDACETTEENGMKISFAVNINDIRQFRSTALNFFSNWKVKPIFCGENESFYKTLVDQSYQEMMKLCSKSNVELFVTTYKYNSLENNGYIYDGNRVIHVLMGNILYATNINEIKNKLYSNSLTREENDILYSFLNSFKFIDIIRIEANIGDVDVAVSREQLEMTKKTVDYISDKLKEFLTTLEEQYKKDILSEKCIIKRCKEINKFETIKLCKKNIFWEEQFYIDLSYSYNKLIKLNNSDKEITPKWGERVCATASNVRYNSNYRYNYKTVCTYSDKDVKLFNIFTAIADKEHILYCENINKKCNIRYSFCKNAETFMLIYDRDIKDYIEEKFNIKINDLPAPPKVVKQKEPKTTEKRQYSDIFKLGALVKRDITKISKKTPLTNEEIEIALSDTTDKKYYYIEMKSGLEIENFLPEPCKVINTEFKNIENQRLINSIEYHFSTNIYLVNKKAINDVKNNKNWISLKDELLKFENDRDNIIFKKVVHHYGQHIITLYKIIDVINDNLEIQSTDMSDELKANYKKLLVYLNTNKDEILKILKNDEKFKPSFFNSPNYNELEICKLFNNVSDKLDQYWLYCLLADRFYRICKQDIEKFIIGPLKTYHQLKKEVKPNESNS